MGHAADWDDDVAIGDDVALIERGTVVHRDGRRRRLVTDPHRRISAAVDAQAVTLERRLGVMGTSGGVTIGHPLLRQLLAAVRHWARAADGWAFCGFTCSGFPGGMGGGWVIQAPGRDAKWDYIGTDTIGGRRGRALSGKETCRRLPQLRQIAPGVRLEAEIRFAGDPGVPSGGWPVGARYRLAPGVTLTARRGGACLRVRDRKVWIEGHEEPFLARLADGGGRGGR